MPKFEYKGDFEEPSKVPQPHEFTM
ncbi:unnamed protein product [Allacma fusca]|uniref:Uncharacterized protein n=1 Tax=Allacma fusca TaxID=39272 RepID=A0A8J2J4I1_9HEXA|nr:unnamed protein product [Allacma fusca]